MVCAIFSHFLLSVTSYPKSVTGYHANISAFNFLGTFSNWLPITYKWLPREVFKNFGFVKAFMISHIISLQLFFLFDQNYFPPKITPSNIYFTGKKSNSLQKLFLCNVLSRYILYHISFHTVYVFKDLVSNMFLSIR